MRAVIFHNPKCSKSRATFRILKEKQIEFEVIEYLKNPPTETQLRAILTALKISARELMRHGEQAYQVQQLANPNLSETDLIQAMIASPILIERPIVRTDKGIVIARPPERVLAIL